MANANGNVKAALRYLDTHRAEFLEQLVDAQLIEIVQVLEQAVANDLCHCARVPVSGTERFGQDLIDEAEFIQTFGRDPHRFCRVRRLIGTLPQDRRAALR